MTKQKYTVKPLEENDEEEAMDFLRRTFYIDEPLNRAVGLYQDNGESHPYLDNYCRKALQQRHSLKAVDDNGHIIALMVNAIEAMKEPEDGTDMLSYAKSCTDKKFQKILYIIVNRSAAKLWEKYPDDDRLMEIKVAATDPGWRRRGIMNQLMVQTETKAKELGINLLRIDTSSEFSAKSAQHFEFSCVYEAAYSDIKLDGQPLIVPEPPHIYDRVYIKKL